MLGAVAWKALSVKHDNKGGRVTSQSQRRACTINLKLRNAADIEREGVSGLGNDDRVHRCIARQCSLLGEKNGGGQLLGGQERTEGGSACEQADA